MNTDELVVLLARDVRPVRPGAATRRLALACAVGVAGAAVLAAGLLGWNAELRSALRLPLFWVKAAFVIAMFCAAAAAARRLATPGAALRHLPLALAVPVVVLWSIAGVTLAAAAPADRPDLLLGTTWRVCALNIAVLSVPAFAAVLWAMRGLAPTRLRVAGAAAGLFAGATGTLVYTLHCPELAPPFIALWYVLGMLVPVAAGALVAPRWLRW